MTQFERAVARSRSSARLARQESAKPTRSGHPPNLRDARRGGSARPQAQSDHSPIPLWAVLCFLTYASPRLRSAERSPARVARYRETLLAFRRSRGGSTAIPASVMLPLSSSFSASVRFRLLQWLPGLRGAKRTVNVSGSMLFTRLSIHPKRRASCKACL